MHRRRRASRAGTWHRSEKQLKLLRSQAYVDYLRAVAKAAHASSIDAQRSALADAADAKARIAVYGSARVVQALAAFEHAGPTLDNLRSTACFLAVVSGMRMQAGEAAVDDLKTMLIAPTTPAPSER